MSGFEKALEEEIAALEADVATNPDPRIRKLDHLRSLRTLYVPAPSNGQAPSALAHLAPAPPSSNSALHGVSLFLPSRGVKGVRRRVAPGRIKVMEAARNIVGEFREPVKTAEVYDLMDAEVQALIGGLDPKANLSAMMHHSPMFKSHGRGGWTLAERDAPNVPDDEGYDPDLQREDALTSLLG